MPEDLQKNNIIEELYNNHMWVTDLQYQFLCNYLNQDGYTEEKLLNLLHKNEDIAKKNFTKVFNRMGNKERYYYIPECIFAVGQSSKVRVECKYKFQRLVGRYKVVVSPYFNYDYQATVAFDPYTIVVEAKDNCISVPYTFEKEDMYSINVFYLLDEKELLLLSTNVYALNEDLFGYYFYKADFHMHTTYSDGYEPPEFVAVSARECGMDIIAVTDHNGFYGSVATRDKVVEMGLDMTVILGEEYSLEYSPMHILALGTQKPIDRIFLTNEVLNMPETKKIIKETTDISCDVKAYACTQVLLDEVSKIGGVSILAHPYWKPIAISGTRTDTPENLYIELGKNRKFAGFELVSGSKNGEIHVSNLQASMARTILGTFEGVPLIGITDSHSYSTDAISGKHYTIVIAKSKNDHDILDALKCGQSVAVEIANGIPMCYGNHRFVKIAQFLIRYYFPKRDANAKKEAQFIKEQFLLRRISKEYGEEV